MSLASSCPPSCLSVICSSYTDFPRGRPYHTVSGRRPDGFFQIQQHPPPGSGPVPRVVRPPLSDASRHPLTRRSWRRGLASPHSGLTLARCCLPCLTGFSPVSVTACSCDPPDSPLSRRPHSSMTWSHPKMIYGCIFLNVAVPLVRLVLPVSSPIVSLTVNGTSVPLKSAPAPLPSNLNLPPLKEPITTCNAT